MRIKNLYLYSMLVLLAMISTACGTSATPEVATAISEPTLPAPTDTSVPNPTDTSVPQPTQTTAAATEPATATVSFVNDVLPVFESRCINCHGGEKTNEGLDLKTYDSLMSGSKNGTVLTPGDANDSFIVKQVVEGKMPKRGPKLTPAQIQILMDWVNAGALNN
jgi:hypothetical protein